MELIFEFQVANHWCSYAISLLEPREFTVLASVELVFEGAVWPSLQQVELLIRTPFHIQRLIIEF